MTTSDNVGYGVITDVPRSSTPILDRILRRRRISRLLTLVVCPDCGIDLPTTWHWDGCVWARESHDGRNQGNEPDYGPYWDGNDGR